MSEALLVKVSWFWLFILCWMAIVYGRRTGDAMWASPFLWVIPANGVFHGLLLMGYFR